MAMTQLAFQTDELDPIEIVEDIAQHNSWEFDRVDEDQIAMLVEGQWRSYALTLAWSPQDETLRLVCTFEMEPPEDRLPAIYEVVNAANDYIWSGTFTYWLEPKLMVYRYGLVLSGGQMASAEQIDRMIGDAVAAAERFYPAFQLVGWGGHSATDALQVAIAEAFGHA
ncbi:YbjN domain-containing protein [Palleronia sp. LCG004]|uniref:YbjN domain-containing protein n=1 Tax=Palleronia sp. LCG004 TaxID=3079304 RepID=UPI0029423783|nr:YbjN domain-containing protein [Palleronia sp. LCG004]WOI56784.1 YbjN domain-containing protein [Palleronia sp. LCG004]